MWDYNLHKIKLKLEQYINTCNVNILIGAGFSKPSLPDMNQIKTIFREIISTIKNDLTLEKLQENLIKEKVDIFLVNDTICLSKAIKTIHSYFKENLKDTDSILARLDSGMNFEEILHTSNLEKIVINDESNNLSNCFVFLFFEIFKIIRENTEYEKNIVKNQELIDWLFKTNEFHIKRTSKDTINIFTTNYDTLIEEALENSKYYYYNGFHGTILKRFDADFYDYSYFDNMDLNKNFYQVKKSIFNLYKLHGSITWQITKNKDGHNLTEVGIKKDINLDWPTSYPHIIYPSIDKYDFSLNYEHYYELLRKFKDALYKEDSCLLIFGFSLKDNHIWNIIDKALSKGKLSVFIFTSDFILKENNKKLDEKEIENNFRQGLLSKSGINFVCIKNYDFSKFFKAESKLPTNNKAYDIKDNLTQLGD